MITRLSIRQFTLLSVVAAVTPAAQAPPPECPGLDHPTLCPPPLPAPPAVLATVPPDGMYTDQPSYSTMDPIQVYAHWSVDASYRLRRHENGMPPAQGDIIQTLALGTPGAWKLGCGSFVDYKSESGGLTLRSMAGGQKFTIEGWVRPSYLFPPGPPAEADWQVIAGELSATPSKYIAGLHITKPTLSTAGNRIRAVLKTTGGSVYLVESSPERLVVGEWRYIAMSYDGAMLRLYSGTMTDPPILEGEVPVSGNIANTAPTYFRLGAGQDAPGDRKGCLDGDIDNWGVWNEALNLAHLSTLYAYTKDLGPPAGLPFSKLLMYSAFESDFNDSTPSLTYLVPSLLTANHGTIVNHGTPGVAGVNTAKRGLRLNHDQIVDARMPLVGTFTPPPGGWAPGLYSVEAADASGVSLGMQLLVVRRSMPDTGTPRIAVVLPTATWMAYNSWRICLAGRLTCSA